jgi:hypothetical protein
MFRKQVILRTVKDSDGRLVGGLFPTNNVAEQRWREEAKFGFDHGGLEKDRLQSARRSACSLTPYAMVLH